MSLKNTVFEERGFAIVGGVLSAEACDTIAAGVRADAVSGGARGLLNQPWCVELAETLLRHGELSGLIPDGHLAVQCTFFEKSRDHNWLVPIHQDLSIPVAARVDEPGLGAWSTKDGALFVQAPVALLEQLVVVRVHLDDCMAEDGPLRVVPGSHRHGILSTEIAAQVRQVQPEVTCEAALGSALVMRPLLLHASSKGVGGSRRRVLHFVFGPASLSHGLQWKHAA